MFFAREDYQDPEAFGCCVGAAGGDGVVASAGAGLYGFSVVGFFVFVRLFLIILFSLSLARCKLAGGRMMIILPC